MQLYTLSPDETILHLSVDHLFVNMI